MKRVMNLLICSICFLVGVPSLGNSQSIQSQLILNPKSKSNISQKQILESQGVTICIIKQAVATPKGENFANMWGGSMSIGSDGRIRTTDGHLYYANSINYDNRIPVLIEGIDYTLKMTSEGDRIAGFDDENKGPVIGQGSKLRFDQDNWVMFFGNKYKKGGVEINNFSLRFISGTEKLENDRITIFNGQSWQVAK